MSYMWGACGVSKWDGESNEDMYGRFGMSEAAVEMDCEAAVEMDEAKCSEMVWTCDENE